MKTAIFVLLVISFFMGPDIAYWVFYRMPSQRKLAPPPSFKEIVETRCEDWYGGDNPITGIFWPR